VLGNTESNGAWFAGNSAALRLCRINGAALAGINRLAVFGGGPFALVLKIFFGAKAKIGFVLVEQFFCVCAIDLEPVGLPIRAVGAAHVGAFVPVETEPFQVGDELIFKADFAAIDVGVFDAKYHSAALLAGEEPVEESGAGVADVKVPGGGWSETYTHGRLRHEMMLANQDQKHYHRGHREHGGFTEESQSH
jgi:hypothetical protein